jgi:hypothetical protein
MERTATERVGGEEEEGGTRYHFDDAINSCCEETSICTLFELSALFSSSNR